MHKNPQLTNRRVCLSSTNVNRNKLLIGKRHSEIVRSNAEKKKKK